MVATLGLISCKIDPIRTGECVYPFTCNVDIHTRTYTFSVFHLEPNMLEFYFTEPSFLWERRLSIKPPYPIYEKRQPLKCGRVPVLSHVCIICTCKFVKKKYVTCEMTLVNFSCHRAFFL